MKKIVFTGLTLFALAACNNNGIVEIKTDSLRKNLEVNLDKIGDSAKAKGERTLEVIKDKVNELGTKADSARSDSARLINLQIN